MPMDTLEKTDMIEIRWHGRGGQGAKTVALLFGEAVLSQGKFIQAFPEYGPERMGAPVQSFNRISSKPINIHCHVTNPDIVIVLDDTLLEKVNITAGLKENGKIIINTKCPPNELKKKLSVNSIKIYTIDASKISIETIGKNIPNTPMMGALVKISGIIDINDLLEDTKKKMEKKFRNKPEVIEGNLKAIKRAYEEVQS